VVAQPADLIEEGLSSQALWAVTSPSVPLGTPSIASMTAQLERRF
jgi:hypothetical protein